MSVGAIEPQFYAKLLAGLGFSQSEIDDLPHQLDSSLWPEMKERFIKIFKTKTQKEWTEVGSCFLVFKIYTNFITDFPVNRCLRSTCSI